jgi:acyl-coenzyme A synthetase/AMP-(fatty) acid ligase/acyl carrier protein
MIEWMRDEGITIGSGRHLLAYIDGLTEYNKLPDVRLITIGSDVIRKKDIEDCRKFLSTDCIIVVNFATTETGTDRQCFISMDTEITTGVMPVGYEVEGKKILILDDDHQEVGVECVGEIAIKSQYLSPGYWQRPDLTDTKFLPDPDGGNERIYLTGDLGRILSDGCLVHMGRKDFQVHIRGHRIEIGEVENALLSLESIKEAVVVSREDRLDDQRLVAYVVPSGEESPAVSEIRHALLDVLPGYMVPSVFVMLDALPLNVNNKVDRKALPESDTSRPELEVEYIAPGDEMEKMLTDIWKEVLGLDKIGIRDSFFDLGGNSLIAVRLSAKVQEEFGKSIPISALLQAPTIEQLADMLRQEEEFPEQRID